MLEHVEVESAGLSVENLRGSPADPEAIRSSLRDLYATFTDVACSLIGIDLVSPILTRVERSWDEADPTCRKQPVKIDKLPPGVPHLDAVLGGGVPDTR